MIPPFDREGRLPPGIHPASWSEVVQRFGTSDRRNWLLTGLLSASQALRSAGCSTVYLNGSFVTAKERPDDFDGCWEASGVGAHLLDPVLLDFRAGRWSQKVKYYGELFPALGVETSSGKSFLDFFQSDRDTGSAKGIVSIDLGTLP